MACKLFAARWRFPEGPGGPSWQPCDHFTDADASAKRGQTPRGTRLACGRHVAETGQGGAAWPRPCAHQVWAVPGPWLLRCHLPPQTTRTMACRTAGPRPELLSSGNVSGDKSSNSVLVNVTKVLLCSEKPLGRGGSGSNGIHQKAGALPYSSQGHLGPSTCQRRGAFPLPPAWDPVTQHDR